MCAVHNRNFECLRCLIAHGADLNLGNDDITTPLIEAILQHSASPSTCVTRDIVNLLLRSGVDVNQRCYIGVSPIKYAIDNNNIYCIRMLIQKGAQFDRNDTWFNAAVNKNIHLLRLFVGLGVDINRLDSLRRNVLWYAVNSGDIRVISYLLEAGIAITTNVGQQFFSLYKP